MGSFEIREAQKGDSYIISSLLHQLGYETSSATVESLLLDAESDGSDVVVGLIDGVVVSVISVIYFDYFPSGEKFCRITALVVDANIRACGIGSKLIDYAKAQALMKKCNVLEVTTSLKREQTQAFYEKIGFNKRSYKYVKKLSEDI